MTILDGHYHYDDVTMSWDSEGVTFARQGQTDAAHAPWGAIYGARQVGGDPGYVQVRVLDHLPLADPRRDPFTMPVASQAGANRLLTIIRWRTTEVAPGRPRRRRSPTRAVPRGMLGFGRSSAS
jgi:hypothetical protein